ncbi:MAG: DUF2281 domain-containing protein [Bacteroidales bacterium]|jgi:hypothetical protein|nr:DUF2281 domain-containing protein [Bacteroidales bacterium]
MNTIALNTQTTGLTYGRISQLPQEIQRELSDYIEFLLLKYPTDKSQKPHPRAGYMKGTVTWMSDDFNAPLEDFKEYM